VHSPYALYTLLRNRTTRHLVDCRARVACGLARVLAVLMTGGARVLPEASKPVPALREDDHHVPALTMSRTARGAATAAAP